DARRLAGIDATREGPAGRDLADQLQAGRGGGDILGAHRIAVHRRDIFRRLCTARREILREYAPFGFAERDALGCERLDSLEHASERIGDREQRHLYAPFARYVPDLPPRFSIRRMPSMRMPRSTAFTMS